ncbi:ExbD/TolR family protein [Bythopirellula polymerisocia]|uniref:Colicin uptake protein TolR n=1 Tax=Bythopirellula polymerisocia TaxID=2528003 RepID=A0A5C6CUC3_9BACT|nr:biopolymer transporter ExbD [Bythopirellula polymerisocia]TWU27254.1 colicin uptake protein TolR [Bythopirellula polymerisocia]
MNDSIETDDWTAGGVMPARSSRVEDAEMDITPMIDITFLLLIFFLVCSTPDQKTAIELPKAKYGKGVGERNSVIFTVSDEGVDNAPIYLGDGKIDAARLSDDPDEQSDLIVEAVEKGRREENKENVLIKADRNVAYREVERVVKAASRVEGAKIYLAVMESN